MGMAGLRVLTSMIGTARLEYLRLRWVWQGLGNYVCDEYYRVGVLASVMGMGGLGCLGL